MCWRGVTVPRPTYAPAARRACAQRNLGARRARRPAPGARTPAPPAPPPAVDPHPRPPSAAGSASGCAPRTLLRREIETPTGNPQRAPPVRQSA
ncbi:MAG: hypothetical protein DMD70_01555 [Gemmatimonadetes bacterium]|nr:MAG: hypothetical protein DMD70_01555 [Gemmatimonadota bacterium]